MNARPKVAALVAGGMIATVAGLASSGPATGQDAEGSAGPVAPLADDGTWLIDAEERVVLLHGVNEVYKDAPYYPAADDFGEADAEFLAEHGFNVVRLGIQFQALMPEPGEIDHDYIENLATTVEDLAAEDIFVLLDFHQDGYGPVYTGNGFPEWMSIDDGEFNNPDTEFPLYYIQNPAMQRAFQNFWANREGPDGVGLQEHFIDGLTAVVERFAGEPTVVGYEPMNEPWPGHEWEPCAFEPEGCRELEQDLLVPFYEKVTAAVREVTDTQQVWVEPFVLFNFGQAPTSIPGADSGNVLSWHSYALDVAGEEGVAAFAQEAAERDDTPAVATEFGATTDTAQVNRLLDQIEGGLMGWMFWAYNEQVVPGYGGRDDSVPRIEQANVELLTAMVRPYPTAVTGTPTATGFDDESLAYAVSYDTAGPSGQEYGDDLETVLSVPEFRYPDGYVVSATGAEVTSDDNSATLTLVNDAGADDVKVCIAPVGSEDLIADCDDLLVPPGGGDPGNGGTGTDPGAGSGATAPPAVPVAGKPSFTG